ncbi:MAG TPA: hypothetical protein VF172_13400 [Nitrososphaera sp.]
MERKADANAIFNAMLDFSVETVQRLMKEGRDDALRHLVEHQIDIVKHYVELRIGQIKRVKGDPDKTEKDGRSEELQRIEAELLDILQQASSKTSDRKNPSYYEDAISVLKTYVEERQKYIERLGLGALC